MYIEFEVRDQVLFFSKFELLWFVENVVFVYDIRLCTPSISDIVACSMSILSSLQGLFSYKHWSQVLQFSFWYHLQILSMITSFPLMSDYKALRIPMQLFMLKLTKLNTYRKTTINCLKCKLWLAVVTWIGIYSQKSIRTRNHRCFSC